MVGCGQQQRTCSAEQGYGGNYTLRVVCRGQKQQHRAVDISRGVLRATASDIASGAKPSRHLPHSCGVLRAAVAGGSFEDSVRNRTIEVFTALMWCDTGKNFERFARKTCMEQFTSHVVCCGQQLRTSCRQQSQRELYSSHYGETRYGDTRYGETRSGETRYGETIWRDDMARRDPTRRDPARRDMARRDMATR